VSPCNSPWWRVRSSGIEHRVFACHVSMRDTSMAGCRRPSWVTRCVHSRSPLARCVHSRSPLAMCRLATCRQQSIESDNMALAPQVSICHMVRSKWRKGLLVLCTVHSKWRKGLLVLCTVQVGLSSEQATPKPY
jgi:hypothetical protein